MTYRKFLQSILGTILVIWFAVGCSTPTATPISPTATLTPEPPTSTPTVGPGGFPRRFHVEGNAFVDQYGETMVFRGMAPIDPLFQILYAPEHPEYGVWSEHHYHVMADWGANIIRLPIVPDTWRNYIRRYGMDGALHALDQTITWASENKMYVIIDFHSQGWPPGNYYEEGVGAETTPQEIMDFWNTISHRYVDNDVVAFYELFNEPFTHVYSGTAGDWLIWKDFAEQVIAVIRANDPDKIILVGGLQSAYDLSFVADAPVAGSNIAYATHPYSKPDFVKNWDTAFGDLSSQYPVFATEFGYTQGGFSDNDYNGVPYRQAIIDYLEAHHISWTVWCFDATWYTSLLLDVQTYQPSPSGEYFRSRLLELNQRP